MSSLNREQNIKESWIDIKADIIHYWKKLSIEDIEDIDGSYHTLIIKVEKAYQLTHEEAIDKVNEYIQKLGFDHSVQSNEDDKKISNEKVRIATENFEKYIHESIAKIKNTAGPIDAVSEYIRANPFKSIVLAILLGVVI